MIFYSQKDQRWANEKLGTCSDTIAKSGCKITCLASFCGKTPSEVNKIIPYVSGCLTNDETAAKALGLPFGGKSSIKPNFDCIAETDHYKPKGVPQHFFILLADGRCVDPLDLNPTPKKNPYHIVSYRLFKSLINEEPMEMTKDLKEAVELLGIKAGEKLNDKEQDRLAGEIRQVKLNNNRLLENNEELAKKLSGQESILKEYIAKAGTCEPELKTCRDNLLVQTEKAVKGIAAYSISGLFGEIIRRLINSK